MKRPTGIAVTTFLMAAEIVMSVVQSLIVMPSDMGKLHATATASRAGVLSFFGAAMALLLIIEILAVWAYWRGRFWARRLILLGCVVYLLPLAHLRASSSGSLWNAALTLYGAALAVFLLFYLFTRKAKAWFIGPETSVYK